MKISHPLAAASLLLAAACSPFARPATTPAPTPSRPAADAARGAGPTVVVPATAAQAGAAGAAAVARQADSIRISVGDVKREAQRVFGDSVVAGAEEREPADAENGPTWDIDVEPYVSQSRVEHFVRAFSGPARERLEVRLSRGTRYEPMIRQRLREGGVPEDMYYLALIESGFDPHAYSRAAAVGMWQFMTSTGRGMGLRIDWWVDERRDPVRSTAAAVRFIRGLRDQFGSLYLAAAAYNGGPGRVARGLKRFEDELEGQEDEDVFFALAEQDFLPKETKDYVPQLIAAALVAKDPARYGLDIRTQPAFAYDSARVGPESSLPAIARAAGTTTTVLRDLNPHLLRGVTPPRVETTVRLPVGARERFAREWAQLDRSERAGLRRVVTRKGVSLDAIARDAGITTRQLVGYNPGGVRRTKKGRVIVGQTLVVPTSAVVAAALVVPDPEIERYGSATRSARGKGTRSVPTLHVVKRGENLSTIARRHKLTVAKLQKLNRLRKPIIFPGQTLVVSGDVPSSKARGAKRDGVRVVQAGRASDEGEPAASKPKPKSRAASKVTRSRTTSASKAAGSKRAAAGKTGTSRRATSKATASTRKTSTKASAAKKGRAASGKSKGSATKGSTTKGATAKRGARSAK